MEKNVQRGNLWKKWKRIEFPLGNGFEKAQCSSNVFFIPWSAVVLVLRRRRFPAQRWEKIFNFSQLFIQTVPFHPFTLLCRRELRFSQKLHALPDVGVRRDILLFPAVSRAFERVVVRREIAARVAGRPWLVGRVAGACRKKLKTLVNYTLFLPWIHSKIPVQLHRKIRLNIFS